MSSDYSIFALDPGEQQALNETLQGC